jgi:hypothetical protein
MMRQISWNRKTWAGQPEQENLGRTAGTGKPGRDSRYRTVREDIQDGTGRKRKSGQDGQNMTEGYGGWDGKTEIGQL